MHTNLVYQKQKGSSTMITNLKIPFVLQLRHHKFYSCKYITAVVFHVVSDIRFNCQLRRKSLYFFQYSLSG